MPEHEIKFDLLTPNEQNVLNRFGVKIKEQGIDFERQLSEADTRWVGCILLQLKGISLSIADVFSPSTAKRKTTLGLLKNALIDKGIFVADFENRLNKFVDDRNKFAHYHFVENLSHPAEGYEAIMASQLSKLNFITDLRLEANNLNNLFYGLWYSLGEDAAVREGKMDDLANSPFGDWAKYKQDFLNVRAS